MTVNAQTHAYAYAYRQHTHCIDQDWRLMWFFVLSIPKQKQVNRKDVTYDMILCPFSLLPSLHELAEEMVSLTNRHFSISNGKSNTSHTDPNSNWTVFTKNSLSMLNIETQKWVRHTASYMTNGMYIVCFTFEPFVFSSSLICSALLDCLIHSTHITH